MRALITGACGFVGRYLASYLLEQGDDILGTVYHNEQIAQFPVKTLDIQVAKQVNEVIASYKPDVVYHLAAISFVPDAEQDFQLALAVNVGAVDTLMSAVCSSKNHPKLVFVSSAEVYGRVTRVDLPITEAHPVRPENKYSLTKAMAEMIVERYFRSDGGDAVILRPFNHIGPGQNDRFVASSFARQLARISRGVCEPKLLVGNLEASRDFSDVRDVVRAYRLAALRGKGVYNIGSGRSIQIQRILDILIEISGVNVNIERDPERMRPSDVPEVYGSSERARSELGWAPEYRIEDTLRAIYEDWVELEAKTGELLM